MTIQTMLSITHVDAPKDKKGNPVIVAHQHDGFIHAGMVTHVPYGGYVNFNVDVPCTVYFSDSRVFGVDQQALQPGDNFLDVACKTPAETEYSFDARLPGTSKTGPIIVVP